MSQAPRPKMLTEEDRVLWTLVARTAQPLRGRVVPTAQIVAPETETSPKPGAASASTLVPAPKKEPRVTASLDRPTLDKLAKGRLPIEGRVDLHGLTQDEAYSLLFSFLSRAQQSGVRFVLVITGKGSSTKGDGILRRVVPAWLATPPFRALVSSHDEAARQHGGGGALYIRLRRLVIA